jgi:hypothetical protein
LSGSHFDIPAQSNGSRSKMSSARPAFENCNSRAAFNGPVFGFDPWSASDTAYQVTSHLAA